MKRLFSMGLGVALVMSVLFAVALLHEPSVAQAMGPDEAVAASGFDCAEVSQIPQSECEALVTFYYATGGDGWYYDDGWLVTNTPCDWYGITCDAGHVTGLDSGSNDLVGSIPPELATLSQLTVLSLWGNLNGFIPPELGGLSQLEAFSLWHNEEDVSIPPELGNLSSLQTLYISPSHTPTDQGDPLRDGCPPIPSELGNLSNLQTLVIIYSVCGTIPPELGNLSNLQTLDLGVNSLTGSIPPELGNLSNLTHLDLGRDGNWVCTGWPVPGSLSGPLPPELGNLTNLEFLDLACHEYSGPIPMTFINLQELQHFYFYTPYDNYLCEPSDPAFQAWIDAVPSVAGTGVICEPTSIELGTLGTQRESNARWLLGIAGLTLLALGAAFRRRPVG